MRSLNPFIVQSCITLTLSVKSHERYEKQKIGTQNSRDTKYNINQVWKSQALSLQNCAVPLITLGTEAVWISEAWMWAAVSFHPAWGKANWVGLNRHFSVLMEKQRPGLGFTPSSRDGVVLSVKRFANIRKSFLSVITIAQCWFSLPLSQ